jgi:Flp pilus assembly protein TadG
LIKLQINPIFREKNQTLKSKSMGTNRLAPICKNRLAGLPIRRGAATVELAILLPVLITILVGALEIGNMFSIKSALQNAAREGARHAVLPLATPESVTTSCNQSLAASGLTGVAVAITPSPKSAKSGTMISVSVSATYSQNSWLPSGGILGDKQLVSTVVMRKE